MWQGAHLDELALEDYVRPDRRQSGHFAQLEAHLAGCPECRMRADELVEYVCFLFSEPTESAGHIYRRHSTPHGTIFLIVTGSDVNGWRARIIGADHHHEHWFRRGSLAKAALERWFRRAVPAHRCTNQCGSNWNSADHHPGA